jgi:RHS repeat-associated protein
MELAYLYDADLHTLTDNYTFGMQMPERTYEAAGIAGHRYGYNGKENDDDVKGEGNQQDYGFRIYDPRVARFLRVDPKAPMLLAWSSYATALDNSLILVDPEGQYPVYFITRSNAPNTSYIPSWLHCESDNRGHTMNRPASYRTMVSIMNDTMLKTTDLLVGRPHRKELMIMTMLS